MFNLGLGEILLVALAFFLISPKDLPKLMRKLGEYVAKIRQWMRETGVDKAQAEIQALGRNLESVWRRNRPRKARTSLRMPGKKGMGSRPWQKQLARKPPSAIISMSYGDGFSSSS